MEQFITVAVCGIGEKSDERADFGQLLARNDVSHGSILSVLRLSVKGQIHPLTRFPMKSTGRVESAWLSWGNTHALHIGQSVPLGLW